MCEDRAELGAIVFPVVRVSGIAWNMLVDDLNVAHRQLEKGKVNVGSWTGLLTTFLWLIARVAETDSRFSGYGWLSISSVFSTEAGRNVSSPAQNPSRLKSPLKPSLSSIAARRLRCSVNSRSVYENFGFRPSAMQTAFVMVKTPQSQPLVWRGAS